MKVVTKSLLTATIFLFAGMALFAQTEDWQNPGVVERNRLPMSTFFTTDQQNTLSLLGKSDAEVGAGGGLANATFLVCDCYYSGFVTYGSHLLKYTH